MAGDVAALRDVPSSGKGGGSLSRPVQPAAPLSRDVLQEMAVQGQTVFKSGGDAGASAANRDDGGTGTFPVFPTVGAPAAHTPIYSLVAYAADPLVTACGGTELPFSTTYDGYPVVVPAEQPWSSSAYVEAVLAGRAGLAAVKQAFEYESPRATAASASPGRCRTISATCLASSAPCRTSPSTRSAARRRRCWPPRRPVSPAATCPTCPPTPRRPPATASSRTARMPRPTSPRWWRHNSPARRP